MGDSNDAKELFLRAVELAPEQRAEFLAEACGDDDELRAEVESLVAHHDEDTARVERQAAAAVAAPDPERIGEFRILRRLGVGGMGVVYLAREESLDRLVALKVLAPALARSERDIARFRHEAKVIAKLTHPSIVPIYRFGEVEDIHYIAIEYVEGDTLDESLRQTRSPDGATPDADAIKEAAGIIAVIADALDHAHRHEVVHRDVKPSNIIIANDGLPHLTDFGLARNVQEESIIAPGEIAGSYFYMSPEQALAKRVGIDHRTDIFSLGVVLYEMLVRERPFTGDTPERILHAITFTEPRRVRALNPAIPRDLETICHMAIEKDPDHRYQTAAHMAADLRCFGRREPILARPPTLVRRTRRFIGRHRGLTATVGALLVGLAAGPLGAWWILRTPAHLSLAAHLPEGVETPDDLSMTLYKATEDGLVASPATSGERVVLRRTVPVDEYTSTTLDPGVYDVVFEAADGAWIADTRVILRPDEDLRLDLSLFDPGATPGDMALVPGRGRAPAFWIDQFEVSNAQYQAFLSTLDSDEAAGLRPNWWPEKLDTALNDRPVTGVTWRAAMRYAAWAGKRLPSREEWDRAVQGSSMRRFPWGDDEAVSCFANAGMIGAGPHQWVGADVTIENLALGRADYLAATRPVGDPAAPVDAACETQFGSDRADVTIDGICHLYGNVMEWTSSVVHDAADPLGRRYVKGKAWASQPDLGDSVLAPAAMEAPAEAVWLGLGFRCARTAY